MRTKITDGDLLLIEIPNTMNQDSYDKLGKIVAEWLRGKGLTNVDARIVPMKDSTKIGVTCLSVNDVLEETILK